MGDALLDEFLRTTALISEHPKLYRAVDGRARLAMLRRFPYLVVYVEEESFIEVIAVMHAHRNPEIWKARLR